MTRTISEESVINWAKNTLAMLAEIHDPEDHTRTCKHCPTEVRVFRGRHSGVLWLRHMRGGCKPQGCWIAKEMP